MCNISNRISQWLKLAYLGMILLRSPVNKEWSLRCARTQRNNSIWQESFRCYSWCLMGIWLHLSILLRLNIRSFIGVESANRFLSGKLMGKILLGWLGLLMTAASSMKENLAGWMSQMDMEGSSMLAAERWRDTFKMVSLKLRLMKPDIDKYIKMQKWKIPRPFQLIPL